jgi:hypothetical protein
LYESQQPELRKEKDEGRGERREEEVEGERGK